MNRAMRLLPLALLATISISSFASAQVNPAVVAAPRNDWMEKSDRYSDKSRKGGFDVLFLGDSITEAWGNKGVEAWQANFDPLKAVNFGIGGDRTENVLWRVQNGNLSGPAPKVIVLMIGTNNIPRDTAPQVFEGIKAILAEIQSRAPQSKVLLLGILARGQAPNTLVRQEIIAVNGMLAGLESDRVHFLDIGQRFLQPDGSLSPDISFDFTHLTPAGYRIYAEAILPEVKKLLN